MNPDDDLYQQLQNVQQEIVNRQLQERDNSMNDPMNSPMNNPIDPTDPIDPVYSMNNSLNNDGTEEQFSPLPPVTSSAIPNYVFMTNESQRREDFQSRQNHRPAMENEVGLDEADPIINPYQQIIDIYQSRRQQQQQQNNNNNSNPLFKRDSGAKSAEAIEKEKNELKMKNIRLVQYMLKERLEYKDIFKDVDVDTMTFDEIMQFLTYLQHAHGILEIDVRGAFALDILHSCIQKFCDTFIEKDKSRMGQLAKTLSETIDLTYNRIKNTNYQIKNLIHLLNLDKLEMAEQQKLSSTSRCQDFITDLSMPVVIKLVAEIGNNVLNKLYDKDEEEILSGIGDIGNIGKSIGSVIGGSIGSGSGVGSSGVGSSGIGSFSVSGVGGGSVSGVGSGTTVNLEGAPPKEVPKQNLEEEEEMPTTNSRKRRGIDMTLGQIFKASKK